HHLYGTNRILGAGKGGLGHAVSGKSDHAKAEFDKMRDTHKASKKWDVDFKFRIGLVNIVELSHSPIFREPMQKRQAGRQGLSSDLAAYKDWSNKKGSTCFVKALPSPGGR